MQVLNWTLETLRARGPVKVAASKGTHRRDTSGERSNDDEDEMDVRYFRATPYQEGSHSSKHLMANLFIPEQFLSGVVIPALNAQC